MSVKRDTNRLLTSGVVPIMSDQTSQAEDVEAGAASVVQERDVGDNAVQDSLPIGAVLRKLRGERTLRDVQRATGVANSYLCNVELGYQQPGFKFLSRVAGYYRVSMADIIRHAENLRDQALDPEEARVADVERSYRFIMDDPKLRPCEEPEAPLPIEAKRHMVRMYELLTGRLILN